ncbi:hypothetical protein NLG97_g441 [Lecanicillium saksenae]|uniref:Uncharacterized protein n=1 Tax=Lecanicillium saksenae TaxID=468837 RepID=A0ACC1R8E8_9HYPO|nr:hypothetical protein NLG97_g441 [Lecanicillium saksenae]
MVDVQFSIPPTPDHESLKLADALLYFALRIQPKVIRQEKGSGAFQSTRPSVKAHMVTFPDAFIMRTINHNIVTITQESRMIPKYGAIPSINYLWRLMYEYIASTMKELNRLISEDGDPEKVLHYILGIFAIEGTIVDSAWNVHAEGFASLVQLYGGVEKLAKDPMTAMAIRHMLIYATVANTTSPMHDQVVGFNVLTNAEIIMAYSHSGFSSFPCATTMFLDMMQITHFRRCCAADSSAAQELMPQARDVFCRLQDFNASEWKETYPVTEQFELLAETFRAAIILYGILSLPPLLSSQCACPDYATTERPHLYYRTLLFNLVAKGMKTLERNECFTWPIAVLGVAFWDGSPMIHNTLLQYLDGIIMRPGVDCGAVTLTLRLREFWASNKSSWEGCFYRLTSVLA